jgi:hypothetical protein
VDKIVAKSSKEKSREMRLRVSNAIKNGEIDPELPKKYTVEELHEKVASYRMNDVKYRGLAKSIYKKYRDEGLAWDEILKKADYYQAKNNAKFNGTMASYWSVVLKKKQEISG